jgi:hypothetical protein
MYTIRFRQSGLRARGAVFQGSVLPHRRAACSLATRVGYFFKNFLMSIFGIDFVILCPRERPCHGKWLTPPTHPLMLSIGFPAVGSNLPENKLVLPWQLTDTSHESLSPSHGPASTLRTPMLCHRRALIG